MEPIFVPDGLPHKMSTARMNSPLSTIGGKPAGADMSGLICYSPQGGAELVAVPTSVRHVQRPGQVSRNGMRRRALGRAHGTTTGPQVRDAAARPGTRLLSHRMQKTLSVSSRAGRGPLKRLHTASECRR
jgi:hypothetical protein